MSQEPSLYTNAIYEYFRRSTREVKVGDVGVGGDNPIRVQSMTIADTKDTEAVVAETKGLVEVGCEIVRITAPTIHHAENLKNIRDRLRQEGIQVPLVADIHFTPQAALIAADYVEKVRINPGNYADRKLFAVKEYTDSEYEAELERMAEKFLPLVKKCKTNGVAMRIGTNHGSLSDRIMNRFGDTPEGMVESALEFARLCHLENYQDLIFSMKASSPFIMIQAYRLLAQRMKELGMDYPFHLGVTEAGEGEDGRIKSAIGIGSLLEDGIGDTVRVSLTEDSVHEIPVAKLLVKKFNDWNQKAQNKNSNKTSSKTSGLESAPQISWDPIVRERRTTRPIRLKEQTLGDKSLLNVSYTWSGTAAETVPLLETLQQGVGVEERGDMIFLSSQDASQKFESFIKQAHDSIEGLQVAWVTKLPSEAMKILENTTEGSFDAVLLHVTPDTSAGELTQISELANRQQTLLVLRFPSASALLEHLEVLRTLPPLLLSVESQDPIHDYRRLAHRLSQEKLSLPLQLFVDAKIWEDAVLEGASALGGLLMDGIGDAIEIAGLNHAESIRLAFNVLQASRLRISKAEFIACPSCGRTLFDLQETTQRIKSKTAHLKGVKIAIMGCIVNGPGEMADADFGYVGGGPGKIHLYVGKDCVEKNIPSAVADEKLIDLIKSHGQWVEPPALKTSV